MNAAMAGAPGAGQQVSPADMMIAEMKGMADCFARMSESCYSKCIAGVKEEKMSVGEMSCVDRCVMKYLDVHQRVATELQAQQAQAASQPAQSE
mmetsp:Transcript_41572/g.62816  ORF Transcript_41572/g.62816 Transcript_41572/m.62816 type:complete len:94 (-) Transcript_41572:167-448(-)|eukprot:CAMPEP_0194764078 /NCGR_PEP_ID=MMETSP0323_2-20130528/20985_1 /TAXON_ID=2866 ORGANISM="Crypthecodinium cohnii, Strain Seligo" /NCGR_SAMPLE_ID=MMETSP0323_2 /ASSEMBLY_ACC=CAM_ASM_000346 /LENGTH=93 /DNA_ID=CAMNT_0039690375 /DNA_START=32 /DNA_END=313 /DNA_ORIENTATION=+